MAGLTSMMNIGKEMEKKLTSIGFDSSQKLIEAGAKNVYLLGQWVQQAIKLANNGTVINVIVTFELNNLSES